MSRNNKGHGSDPGHGSMFKPEFVEQAQKLATLGATDREIGEFFGVTDRTLRNWKYAHPEFAESLKVGKEVPDNRVERSLYERAVGYSYEAEKIHFTKDGAIIRAPYVEHVPPDPMCARLWLMNRCGWSDRASVEHGGPNGSPITLITGTMTPQEAAAAYAATVNNGKG